MPSPPSAPAAAALVDDIRFEQCVIRPSQRELLVGGKPAKLGARAFDLLLTLIQHRDRMMSKHELLELVWPGMIVEENNLQVHISTLRKLLSPQVITTIPGRGYRFTATLDSDATHVESALENRVAIGASTAVSETTEKGNLPSTVPTLFGRDDDIVTLAKLVIIHPVVTIVGAGGLGKTRLAQAAAHTLRDAHTYADGAWLVELAPVSDPALLPAAVAQALGFTLPGKKSAQDEVIDVLHNRALLLVLDNCEHLVDAASLFAQAVVDHAPQVHLLATSQELLKVYGEHLYRLGTLALPNSADFVAAQASAAVALFVERVGALQPAFTLTEHNVADVTDICRQLDGLPLALELAAARVPLLGVAGVRERLNERFRMLTGGARAAPRRQQTLHETLDWSHSLLTADERSVFRRAGVFVGGFTLPAAQHALADAQLDEWAVLDQLGALVDKSLLVADLTEPPRYRLLESARAYAMEKLQDAGEVDRTRERHAQALLAMFKEAHEQRWTMPSQVVLGRCMPDLDNLRAALDWSQGAADAAAHIALASVSAGFLVLIGHRVECRRFCEKALSRVDADTPPAVEAHMQAVWAMVRSQFSAVESGAIERAIKLYRNIGDARGLYVAVADAGLLFAIHGDIEASERFVHEAALLHDSAWPAKLRWPLLQARNWLHFFSGRYQEGEAVARECLALSEADDDHQLIRYSLSSLERYAAAQGNFAEAAERGRAFLDVVRGHQFASREANGLANYAAALTELGRLDEALPITREAAACVSRDGTLWQMLDAIALLAVKRGRISEAALAHGRSEAMYTKLDQRREDPTEQRAHIEVLGRLREALSEEELLRLLAQGAAMSDEEAARGALAD